jgi:hypothetical protein
LKFATVVHNNQGDEFILEMNSFKRTLGLLHNQGPKFKIKNPNNELQAMHRGLPLGTLYWISKGALSTPLVKGGFQCPAREAECRAPRGMSLLHRTEVQENSLAR